MIDLFSEHRDIDPAEDIVSKSSRDPAKDTQPASNTQSQVEQEEIKGGSGKFL